MSGLRQTLSLVPVAAEITRGDYDDGGMLLDESFTSSEAALSRFRHARYPGRMRGSVGSRDGQRLR